MEGGEAAGTWLRWNRRPWPCVVVFEIVVSVELGATLAVSVLAAPPPMSLALVPPPRQPPMVEAAGAATTAPSCLMARRSADGSTSSAAPEDSSASWARSRTAVFSTASSAMHVAVASGFGVGRCASGEADGGPQKPRQGGSRRSGPRFKLIAHRVTLGYARGGRSKSLKFWKSDQIRSDVAARWTPMTL